MQQKVDREREKEKIFTIYKQYPYILHFLYNDITSHSKFKLYNQSLNFILKPSTYLLSDIRYFSPISSIALIKSFPIETHNCFTQLNCYKRRCYSEKPHKLFATIRKFRDASTQKYLSFKMD